MNLNIRIILNFLGLLTAMNGIFMLFSIPFSLYYGEHVTGSIAIAAGISIVTGVVVWFVTRKAERSLKKRDGYLIVSLGWVVISLSGSLVYYLTGAIPNYTDAFFETISGYSTTGASILTDIESLPKGVLFWRSMTHWIGGMGIIVLTIAILPILGIGGMQLFVAESPGPSADKLTPRIRETAKRLWLIYVILTVVETILLMIGGMSFFEAICHAMATVSTGGFSTRNGSIADFESPFIQYTIILFMFLGGVNFTLTYFMMRGNFKKPWKNEEFRTYLSLIVLLTVIGGVVIYATTGTHFEKSFRDMLFQTVAMITTTGFATADFTASMYPPILTVVLFLLMFVGGSAGSTGGGVKVVRLIIVIKNSFMEFKRLIHPNAIIPVRLDDSAVSPKITFNILAFFLIYLGIFALGAIVMASLGVDFETAVGSSASAIGNIGPGLGEVCPSCNYAGLPTAGKWFLTFQMLVGRLELFSVLILFSPWFWKQS